MKINNYDEITFWLYADIDDVMDYIKAKNNVTNTQQKSGIMLQFVCFVIGAIFGGCFAATVMALIFAHTDLYVKDGDDNNEEKSPQEGE